MEIQIEFLKLEKLEFSGQKGSHLSKEKKQVYEEFKDLFKEFNELQCDVLDPEDKAAIDHISIVPTKSRSKCCQ